jgi:hypothetical protein
MVADVEIGWAALFRPGLLCVGHRGQAERRDGDE